MAEYIFPYNESHAIRPRKSNVTIVSPQAYNPIPFLLLFRLRKATISINIFSYAPATKDQVTLMCDYRYSVSHLITCTLSQAKKNV